MDTSLLVKQAEGLTKSLDNSGFSPSFVMWVHSSDTDTWRLWVAPARATDKRDAYRKIAEVLSKNRDAVFGLDVGSIEVISSDHRAISGLSKILNVNLGSVTFSGNTFNGFYLPDGVVVRVDRSAS